LTEVETKLTLLREAMERHGLGAVRLRGVDWFAWATAGGDSAVLHTTETGVAEVLITPDEALVLTDLIEAARLEAEEAPAGFEVWAAQWWHPGERDRAARDRTGGRPVASDRPTAGEVPLPEEVVRAKRRLLPEEVARYRALGRDAAEAMTAALTAAEPDWTERNLAGRGAAELWARGVHPALVLVGGEGRVARYRHPMPTTAPLGDRAMMVFCARRHGLYANLTRFVYFRATTSEERRLDEAVRAVEAEAFAHSMPGAVLSEVYRALQDAYERAGHKGAWVWHHQGGTTGYLAREVVAHPNTDVVIEPDTALAWNPSLPGAKVEDTVLCTDAGLEVMTADPIWPTVPSHGGRLRPDLLVRP